MSPAPPPEKADRKLAAVEIKAKTICSKNESSDIKNFYEKEIAKK